MERWLLAVISQVGETRRSKDYSCFVGKHRERDFNIVAENKEVAAKQAIRKAQEVASLEEKGFGISRSKRLTL